MTNVFHFNKTGNKNLYKLKLADLTHKGSNSHHSKLFLYCETSRSLQTFSDILLKTTLRTSFYESFPDSDIFLKAESKYFHVILCNVLLKILL